MHFKFRAVNSNNNKKYVEKNLKNILTYLNKDDNIKKYLAKNKKERKN